MKNYVSKEKIDRLLEKGKLTVEKLDKLYSKQLKLTSKRMEKSLKKYEKLIDNEIIKLEVLEIETVLLKEYLKTSIGIDQLKEEMKEVENEYIKEAYEITIDYMVNNMKIMSKTMDKCSELIQKEPEYMVI